MTHSSIGLSKAASASKMPSAHTSVFALKRTIPVCGPENEKSFVEEDAMISVLLVGCISGARIALNPHTASAGNWMYELRRVRVASNRIVRIVPSILVHLVVR